MVGPVSTKSEKDKSAGKVQGRAPELDSRSISFDPYIDIMDLQNMAGNQAVSQLLQPGMDTVPPIVHEVLCSSGQSLDPTTRADMEERFGKNFSHVQVHTDAKAADSADIVNARAYTVGTDIVFATGEYAPHSSSGRYLLAHELAHVVQQNRGGPAPALQADAPHEVAAQRAAKEVISGASPTVSVATGVGMAREENMAAKNVATARRRIAKAVVELEKLNTKAVDSGGHIQAEDATRAFDAINSASKYAQASNDKGLIAETEKLKSRFSAITKGTQAVPVSSPAIDPRHARGYGGEQGMGFGFYRAEDGWVFIEGPSGSAGHGVTSSGFDGVAYNYKIDELHLIDNKSLKSPGDVRSATAIDRSRNLLQNLNGMIGRVRAAKNVPGRIRILQLLQQAQAAVAANQPLPNNVKPIVTAVGGQSAGVSPRLVQAGVQFRSAASQAPMATAKPTSISPQSAKGSTESTTVLSTTKAVPPKTKSFVKQPVVVTVGIGGQPTAKPTSVSLPPVKNSAELPAISNGSLVSSNVAISVSPVAQGLTSPPAKTAATSKAGYNQTFSPSVQPLMQQVPGTVERSSAPKAGEAEVSTLTTSVRPAARFGYIENPKPGPQSLPKESPRTETKARFGNITPPKTGTQSLPKESPGSEIAARFGNITPPGKTMPAPSLKNPSAEASTAVRGGLRSPAGKVCAGGVVGAASLLVAIEEQLKVLANIRGSRLAGSLRTLQWWLQRGVVPTAWGITDRYFQKDDYTTGVNDIASGLKEQMFAGIEIDRLRNSQQYEAFEAWVKDNVQTWDHFYQHFILNNNAGVRWHDSKWELTTWKWSDMPPANVYAEHIEDDRINAIMEPIRHRLLAKTEEEINERAHNRKALIFRNGFGNRSLFSPITMGPLNYAINRDFEPVFNEIEEALNVPEGYALVSGADVRTYTLIHGIRAYYDRASPAKITMPENEWSLVAEDRPFTGWANVNIPVCLVKKDMLTEVPGI